MKSRVSQFRLWSLVCLLLASASSRLTAANFTEMVVFGDSLSDNGNLAVAVGPGLLASRNYDPFRITDGPTTTPGTSKIGVTVEQLNSRLGLAPLSPALLGGNNYAWAFAKTGFETFDAATTTTPGMGLQVASYLASHPAASPNSLYVLWGGANDLLAGNTPSGILAAAKTAIANLTLQMGALLNAGATHVAWFNLPDLSLTPAGASAGPLTSALHDASLQFRADWQATLQQFQFLYPTASLTGVDVFGAFNAITANPSLYGLTNVTSPAQGQPVNPDNYLFWDTLHPTTRGHEILAGVAFQALQPVPEPATYGFLGVTVLAVAIVVRRRAAAKIR